MKRFVFLVLSSFLPIATFGQVTAPPRPESSTTRPRMADSATGYIDNAIVGSQVRFRFDSGFNIDTPDRAEFFYAKCGCYRFLPASNPAFDPDAAGPGGFGQIEDSLDYQELHMEVEYLIANRLSVSGTLPVRALQPSFVPRARGIGDIRIGFKFDVNSTDDRYLTAQFRTFIPSGDARKGLGTNHTSIEPALLYYQRFLSGFALAGEFGYWHPIDGSSGVPTSSDDSFAGDVLTYGFGASQDIYDGTNLRVTPVVEFVAWRVMSGSQTSLTLPADAEGVHIANLKVGARIDSGGRGSFYIGVGKAITDDVWYDDLLRLEYRYAF